ncbi:hypothetical protein BGW80DRAFT_1117131, partial [Lactifluus volemus]
MTDYASQGKTRESNVVDLRYTWTHQGYYTALLRGTCATGTLILGGFHPTKITGGASGALRQEFRELELLDDITTLRFEDRLPMEVAMADHRNSIIAMFRKNRGLHYMPSHLHKSLRWNKRDPFTVGTESMGDDFQWRLVDAVRLKKKLCASEVDMSNNSERQLVAKEITQTDNISSSELHLSKNISDEVTHLSPDVLIPVGTQWETNSCAYDTIITILFNVWRENPVAMTTKWSELNNDTLNYL